MDMNGKAQQQADQVQAKAKKSKFSDLMKKVIKACNRSKKAEIFRFSSSTYTALACTAFMRWT
jgi:hypothetical protein